MKNIYDYFRATIREESLDHSLEELPVNSPCGKDCKRVIDAGARFIREVDPAVHGEIVEAIDHAVAVLWRG